MRAAPKRDAVLKFISESGDVGRTYTEVAAFYFEKVLGHSGYSYDCGRGYCQHLLACRKPILHYFCFKNAAKRWVVKPEFKK